MIVGILASAGHDPVAAMERWTWQQIGLVARSIVASKTWGLRMLVEPLLPAVKDATGLDIKLPGTSRSRSRSTSVDLNDPDAVARAKKRDAHLLGGLSEFVTDE